MKFSVLFLVLVLATSNAFALGPKLREVYAITEVVTHEGDDPRVVEQIVEHVVNTPLELLVSTLDWERASHGQLAEILANEDNLKNLRLEVEGLNTLSMFLRHSVLAPKPILSEHVGDKRILFNQAALARLIQRFAERLARRVQEIERYMANNGEEPPRPPRTLNPYGPLHILNMTRPIPQNYMLPPRIPPGFTLPARR